MRLLLIGSGISYAITDSDYSIHPNAKLSIDLDCMIRSQYTSEDIKGLINELRSVINNFVNA